MDARSLIRKEFVKQVLEAEGHELHNNQGMAIAKLLHFHSNRLMEQRELEVTQSGDMDGTLTLNIPVYGRFLDIKPKNNTIKEDDKYKAWRNKRRKQAYPIYNRYVFGHYHRIAYKLMYGFTNEVANSIKQQFQEQQ